MDILIPSPGESISEVVVAAWLKADGERVEQDEEVLELESEKATLVVAAPAPGILRHGLAAGVTAKVGQVAGQVEGSGSTASPRPATPRAVEAATEARVEAAVSPAATAPVLSPAARKLALEKGVDPASLAGSGKDGRVTKADVLAAETSVSVAVVPALAAARQADSSPSSDVPGPRSERRSPLSQLRQKLAQRLVAAKNQTAMLTTFNEVDMGAVKALRAQWKERFREVHGVELGLMSFFAAAAVRALVEFPQVNSRLEEGELVEPGYVDLGIAVSAPKGLVVPVIRDAQELGLEGIEAEVARLAAKARENRIAIEEMTGGTFTISNGGVFGSLLSTPILNPPQCGILGLHAIQDRPVAREGRVVIRPMMYVALSYDHRLIDGRESVGFLKRVKELVEDPLRLLLKV